MARNNSNKRNNYKKEGSKRNYNNLKKTEPNNYQDLAEDKEYNKGKRSSKGKFPCDKVTSAMNAPTWYFKSPELLRSVASYSYSTPAGEWIDFNGAYPTSEDFQVSARCASIPGVYCSTLALAPGIAIDASSPINLAAQNIYSFVRYKNSGAANYDAPDYMLYNIAIDSLYATWNWMKRIYGYTSTYSAQNKYYPRAFAAADHVDLEDIYQHLADFRAYLNMAANKIQVFNISSTMSYMLRHSWLFANIYKDSNTTKAQAYMHTPAWVYKYDEMTSESGTQLVTIPINARIESGSTGVFNYVHSAKWTFSSLISLLDDMINAVQYSEDVGIMSGDTLKAFGEGGLFKISEFDADFRIEPVYSEEVLMQIENSTTTSAAYTADKFTISHDPNTNFIKYNPILYTSSGLAVSKGKYVNFHHMNVTPEEMIVATRLAHRIQIKDGNVYFNSVGSEFVTFRSIFAFNPVGATDTTPISAVPSQMELIEYYPYVHTTKTPANVLQNVIWMWMLEAFDWAPGYTFTYNVTQATTDKGIAIPEFKDWDVYTYVSLSGLRAMDELALLTEFNVPN